MIDMFSLILGFVMGAVSVIVGFLLPKSRRTKRAADGANSCPICGFGYPAFGERRCPIHGTPRR